MINSAKEKSPYINISLIISAFWVVMYIILLSAWPFGSHFIGGGDLTSQFNMFYDNAQDIYNSLVVNKVFNDGYGISIFPTIAYYLTSPFVLIYIMLESMFEIDAYYITNLIIPLKSVLSGISIMYLLRVIRPGVNNQLLKYLSIAYALGFSLMRFSPIIIWTDFHIITPLVFALMYQYIYHKKFKLLLPALLILSIVTNYYMAFQVFLITGIYLIFFLLTTSNKQAYIKSIALLILSGLSSVPFIYMSVRDIVSSRGVSPFNNIISSNPSNPLSTISALSSIAVSLDSSAMVFSGIALTIPMIVCIYSLLRKKDKLTWFTVLLFLSFTLLEPLNILVHGMSSPIGLEYRFTYIFYIIFISILYKNYTQDDVIKLLRSKTSSIVLAIVFTVSLFACYLSAKPFYFIVIAAAICFLFLHILRSRQHLDTSIYKVLYFEIFICASLSLMSAVSPISIAEYSNNYDSSSVYLNGWIRGSNDSSSVFVSSLSYEATNLSRSLNMAGKESLIVVEEDTMVNNLLMNGDNYSKWPFFVSENFELINIPEQKALTAELIQKCLDNNNIVLYALSGLNQDIFTAIPDHNSLQDSFVVTSADFRTDDIMSDYSYTQSQYLYKVKNNHIDMVRLSESVIPFFVNKEAYVDAMESIQYRSSQITDVTKISNSEFHATVNNTDAQFILFAQSYNKNWACFINGVETEITHADCGLMGINLEPGMHELVFIYSDNVNIPMLCTSILSILSIALLHKKKEPRN